MRAAAIIVGVCLVCIAVSAKSQHTHPQSDEEMNGTAGTITGYVRDAACLFRNPAAGAPSDPVTLQCAKDCVLGGSPLVVLTTEGALYFVLSSAIPDVSQNEKFMPYVGKLVKASGRVFERAGVHAIAIESVEVAPAMSP